jgi:hypothetical protein
MCSTAAALAALTACSEGSATTAPTPTQASFTVSVLPSPVTATRCNPGCASQSGGTTFAFAAAMTITVQESAGIGATINMITLTGSTGSVTFTPLVFSSAQITQLDGSNHVNSRGLLPVPLSIVYDTPSGTANLAVGINVQFTDDQNNQVTATGQVNVI